MPRHILQITDLCVTKVHAVRFFFLFPSYASPENIATCFCRWEEKNRFDGLQYKQDQLKC